MNAGVGSVDVDEVKRALAHPGGIWLILVRSSWHSADLCAARALAFDKHVLLQNLRAAGFASVEESPEVFTPLGVQREFGFSFIRAVR